MKAKIALCFFGMLLAAIAFAQFRMPIDRLPPFKAWDEAYKHAQAGKTVRVTVVQAKLIPGFTGFTPFRVYLVDGNKRYFVAAAMPFPKDSAGNFLFDLSSVLKDLPQAPSADAKVEITGATYNDIRITLVK